MHDQLGLAMQMMRGKLTATDDRHQGHKHGKQDRRQKSSDHTKYDTRNVIDPLQERNVFRKVVDVTDDTDECDRDTPEYNQGGYGNCCEYMS
jgi:hypothetical protein